MDLKTSLTNRIPDEVLIKKILAGEKRLFEHIMRSYNQRLYRIGMSILDNDMEVEDAMQNAYINAYEHLNSFEERSSFGTWLTRIMVNECLAQKKKKMKFKMELENHPGNPFNMKTPAAVLANKELSGVLEKAVGRLPEKYRLVFVLREIEEMSVKQTSETLSIEESNVKARLSRAKMMLRENLNGFMKENVYSFHLTRCNRIVDNVLARLNIE
jgi:RNA polymerase sigma factor (sigma-70 family)